MQLTNTISYHYFSAVSRSFAHFSGSFFRSFFRLRNNSRLPIKQHMPGQYMVCLLYTSTEACLEGGLSADRQHIHQLPKDIQASYHYMEELSAKGSHFDAVVCSSDNLAVGVVKFALVNRLSMPDDLSVIGYNLSLIHILKLMPPAMIASMTFSPCSLLSARTTATRHSSFIFVITCSFFISLPIRALRRAHSWPNTHIYPTSFFIVRIYEFIS